MSVRGRLLAVFAAYVSASIASVVPMFAYAGFVSGGMDGDAGEFLFAVWALSLIAAIYALPVALPTILLTERRRTAGWATFAAAGLILGGLLAIAFTEIPFNGIEPGLSGTLGLAAVTGAMTYWFVAWKLFPPRRMPHANSAP